LQWGFYSKLQVSKIEYWLIKLFQLRGFTRIRCKIMTKTSIILSYIDKVKSFILRFPSLRDLFINIYFSIVLYDLTSTKGLRIENDYVKISFNTALWRYCYYCLHTIIICFLSNHYIISKTGIVMWRNICTCD